LNARGFSVGNIQTFRATLIARGWCEICVELANDYRAPSGNQSCVLVVDNEEGPRISLQYLLERQFRVLSASSGEEALEILRREEVGCLTLNVRDTGIGISSAHLPLLFRKFSQEDPGTNRRFEGLGIGLVLAKKLLERNGASLSVESEKGKGSVFRIHFPRAIEV
jgi:signal transduction histidine kinase